MSDAVFVAVPTYNNQIEFETAQVIFNATTGRKKLIMSGAASLLAMNFNNLWCHALNSREEHGAKWFAMLHGDIIPEPYWADVLITEAEKHNADVMSAVVPIKCNNGLTSTALSNPENPWVPFCRLTMRQIRDKAFPETFDADSAVFALDGFDPAMPEELQVACVGQHKLLVNTGCMVARLDQPWVDRIHFEINDRIVKDANGKFSPNVLPEDWNFSQQVAKLGGKVMATSKVKLVHRGPADYSSTATWGLARDHVLDNQVS